MNCGTLSFAEQATATSHDTDPLPIAFNHFRFFIACAISRWCCSAGSVLPAQSFSFGLSPPLAYRSNNDTASLWALTCIGANWLAKILRLVLVQLVDLL